jgi:hypothetical protein
VGHLVGLHADPSPHVGKFRVERIERVSGDGDGRDGEAGLVQEDAIRSLLELEFDAPEPREPLEPPHEVEVRVVDADERPEERTSPSERPPRPLESHRRDPVPIDPPKERKRPVENEDVLPQLAGKTHATSLRL